MARPTGFRSNFAIIRTRLTAGPRPLQGALSIVDQGLVSGSNFVLSILLARWLPQADYGAYALASSIFLILASIHNSLILEPLGVFANTQYSTVPLAYIRSLSRLNRYLTVPLGAATILIAYCTPSSTLRSALVGMGISLPFILHFWFIRQTHYVHMQPGKAGANSAVYATALIGTLVLLKVSSVVTLITVSLATATAAILAVGFRGPRTPRPPPSEHLSLATIVLKHWNYGKWFLAASACSSLATQIQIFVAAAYLGLGASGTLRALSNLVLPITQVQSALAMLLTPLAARTFYDRGSLPLKQLAGPFTVCMTALTACYAVVLAIAHGPVEAILYGDAYLSPTRLVVLIALVPVGSAVSVGSYIALRAAQQPRYILYAMSLQLPVGVLTSIGLIPRYGVTGAVISMVSASAVGAMAAQYYCRNRRG